MLSGLSGLHELYMERNELRKIEEGTFQHMVNLRILDLNTNMLSVIVKNTFFGIKVLQ